MQRKITLDPSYIGPDVIEEVVRKMKSKSMLGRMLSKYNTRYFVLDVKKGLFYYMVDKNSSVSTARQIPINAIESVSVDTNPQVSADEKNLETWNNYKNQKERL